MEIINRKNRMNSLARKLQVEGKIVGLVPTMGALHEGHMSLVRKAKQICDVVVVSIFVNPTQFNESDDFKKYPRDLTSDAEILAGANVDYIYSPPKEEIYPDGYSTYVTVDDISEKLEGASRPGHFRGVATVVSILLNTVRPNYGFFGQKDAQQVAVIKRLVADLAFETEIEVLPIIREKSGLAMSSRNERLTPEQRDAASIIKSALDHAETEFISGETSAAVLAEIIRNRIETEPLGRIDYVSIVDNATLEPVSGIAQRPVLIAVAVFFGDIRLIDNVVLEKVE